MSAPTSPPRASPTRRSTSCSPRPTRKYKLVLYSAKRARQINAYYSQLGEGLLEYVGPLVDTHVQEKPLSIALREINDDLLTCEDVDPAELAAEEQAASGQPRRALRRRATTVSDHRRGSGPAAPRARPTRAASSSGSAAASPPTRPASCCAGSPSPAHDVTRRPDRRRAATSSAPPTWAALSGKPVAAEVWDDVHEVPHVRHRPARPTWSWSPRPPPTCWPRPRTAWPTTCSPTRCSPPAARSCSPRRCTPRCGSTRPRRPTWPPCAAAGVVVIEPASGRLTGADTGKGRLPDPAEIFEVRREVLPPPALRPRPTWPGAASWSPPAAPASRSTRSGSSATARRASRATPSPARRPPAAPRSRWSPPTSRCPTRPASRSCRVETTARAARGRRRGRGRAPTPS